LDCTRLRCYSWGQFRGRATRLDELAVLFKGGLETPGLSLVELVM
jgi:hypothetical protein